jgi:hypothetical protein
MKKLITLLTATIMVMSMTATISANTIYANPVDVLKPRYIQLDRYGFSGYYNELYFDSNECIYDEELQAYGITDALGYMIIQEDGVWYMYSSRIDGKTTDSLWGKDGWKKAPLADVLAVTPRYEYTLEDMATLQKFFMSNDSVLLRKKPYLDHNADKELNAVDLSLIKYELLH